MVTYETKKIATDNFNTFFCEAGREQKEAIIFLHGSAPGSTSEGNWRDILPELAGEYHVIAPDMYGFGETAHPKSTPANFGEWTELRVKQVIELMDYLEIGKANLVGNSMGGLVSLNLIINHPNRFKNIILMGSAGASMQPSQGLVQMLSYYANPTIDNLRELLSIFVYDDVSLGDDLETALKNRYELIMRPEVRNSYLSMFPSSPDEGVISPAILEKMEHSFLLLHGLNDRVMSMEGSLKLFEHLPNAHLHLFQQCGHWVQVEKKKSFLTLTRHFLQNKFN